MKCRSRCAEVNRASSRKYLSVKFMAGLGNSLVVIKRYLPLARFQYSALPEPEGLASLISYIEAEQDLSVLPARIVALDNRGSASKYETIRKCGEPCGHGGCYRSYDGCDENRSTHGTYLLVETALAASACWYDAEASASSDASASCYRRSEDIRILPMIVAELKLIQVEGQVFLGNVMVAADDATFEQRPERFNIV